MIFKQKHYQSTFGEGSSGHLVLEDLALFCCAFKGDQDNMTPNELMKMHGRRQVYFRIIDLLKLSPTEIESVYRNAVTKQALLKQHLAAANRGEDE